MYEVGTYLASGMKKRKEGRSWEGKKLFFAPQPLFPFQYLDLFSFFFLFFSPFLPLPRTNDLHSYIGPQTIIHRHTRRTGQPALSCWRHIHGMSHMRLGLARILVYTLPYDVCTF